MNLIFATRTARFQCKLYCVEFLEEERAFFAIYRIDGQGSLEEAAAVDIAFASTKDLACSNRETAR